MRGELLGSPLVSVIISNFISATSRTEYSTGLPMFRVRLSATLIRRITPSMRSFHVLQAPGPPSAMDGDQFPGERLGNVVGNHTPVVGAHPGSVGVEDMYDADVQVAVRW